MSIQHEVQFHGVDSSLFDALKERLAHYDITYDEAEKTIARGRGVQAELELDAISGLLKINVSRVPDIVTPGYVIGFLFDQLATLKPAAGSPLV